MTKKSLIGVDFILAITAPVSSPPAFARPMMVGADQPASINCSARSRSLCFWILVALVPSVTGKASIANTRTGTL